MSHSSIQVGRVLEGQYWDRIKGFLRYGDKAPLSDADREIFERIEYTKDLWLTHKEDALVCKMIMKEYEISKVHAYRILNDAKSLFALFNSFNPMAELMIVRQKIDRGLELCESDPDNYAKIYPKMLELHLQWIKDMREEQLRQLPEEEKSIAFTYSMDYSLLGITEQDIALWQARVDLVKKKVKRSAQSTEVTDAEFSS